MGAPIDNGPLPPSNQVYIKGLPPQLTEERLEEIFAPYGNVIWKKVIQPVAQSSIGDEMSLALVQFSTVAEASWLVENLDKNIPEGLDRPILVRFAKSQGARTPLFAQKGKGVGVRSAPYPVAHASGAGLLNGENKQGPNAGAAAILAGMRRAVANKGAAQPMAPDSFAVPEGATPKVGDFIRVEGLPPHTADDQIRDIFEQYGAVAHVRVLNPAASWESGTHCTVAIIRMQKAEEATWIVENLNLNIPSGLHRPVSVRFASDVTRARSSATPVKTAPGKGANWPEPPPPSDQIYVKGLPAGLTEDELRSVFAQYGTVVWTRMLQSDGHGEAVALVQFSSTEEATWVVQNLNLNIPQGLEKPIKVMFSASGAKKAAKGGGKGIGLL